jgi:hypothetical protein
VSLNTEVCLKLHVRLLQALSGCGARRWLKGRGRGGDGTINQRKSEGWGEAAIFIYEPHSNDWKTRGGDGENAGKHAATTGKQAAATG